MKPPRFTAGQMALLIIGGFMLFIGADLICSHDLRGIFGLLSAGILLLFAITIK